MDTYCYQRKSKCKNAAGYKRWDYFLPFNKLVFGVKKKTECGNTVGGYDADGRCNAACECGG